VKKEKEDILKRLNAKVKLILLNLYVICVMLKTVYNAVHSLS